MCAGYVILCSGLKLPVTKKIHFSCMSILSLWQTLGHVTSTHAGSHDRDLFNMEADGGLILLTDMLHCISVLQCAKTVNPDESVS